MNTVKAKVWLKEQPPSQATTYLREALELIDELKSKLASRPATPPPVVSPPS